MNDTVGAELSLRRILRDGGTLSAAAGAVILGSLYYDPEIWLQDYPPDVREKWGPKSEKAKRRTAIAAIPFFLIIFGGVIRSTQQLKRDNGGVLSFRAAFLHAYALFVFFWLFDLLIIDWLFLEVIRPDFPILPGTEGMAGYDDYMRHLTTALPALVLMAIPAALIALGIIGLSRKA